MKKEVRISNYFESFFRYDQNNNLLQRSNFVFQHTKFVLQKITNFRKAKKLKQKQQKFLFHSFWRNKKFIGGVERDREGRKCYQSIGLPKTKMRPDCQLDLSIPMGLRAF